MKNLLAKRLMKIAEEVVAEEVEAALFDDPNPASKKCPRCHAVMDYDSHSMSYKCPRCHHFERGRSRVSSEAMGKVASAKKTITQTYDVVTPESAEDGDFADSGFTGKEWDFDYAEEAYDFLSGEGVSWSNSAGMHPGWWQSDDPERDYHDGSETYYGYHPEGFTVEEIDYINDRLGGGEAKREFCDPEWWEIEHGDE